MDTTGGVATTVVTPPRRPLPSRPRHGRPRHRRRRRSTSLLGRFSPHLVVVGAFVASRIAFWLAGVRFLQTPQWQLLDYRLLQHDPVSSIWHMHMQPPLYNGLFAVLLQLPTSTQKAAGTLVWMAFGLVLALGTYLLLVELRVPPWVSVAVVGVWVVASPSYLFAENWDYLVIVSAALLVLCGLMLVRYLRTGAWRHAAGTAAALCAVVLVNSTYEWWWLVPVVALAVLARRQDGRRFLVAASVPLVLVGTWYVKDVVLFGTTTTSSWTGMNFSRITLFGTSQATDARLVSQKALTRLAELQPFQAITAYAGFVTVPPAPAAPSALDSVDSQWAALPPSERDHKWFSGVPNFNNRAYVELSSLYLHDDLAFVRHEPGQYARAVGLSFANWFTPSDQYFFFRPNRRAVAGYASFYDKAVEWQTKVDPDVGGLTGGQHLFPSPGMLSWQAVVTYGLALLGVPVLVLRRRMQPAEVLALAFLWFTVLYAMLGTNLVELGENNRLRLELGPLPLVAAVVVVTQLVRGAVVVRRRRAA